MKKIRVGIADDNELSRQMLRAIAEMDTDLCYSGRYKADPISYICFLIPAYIKPSHHLPCLYVIGISQTCHSIS